MRAPPLVRQMFWGTTQSCFRACCCNLVWILVISLVDPLYPPLQRLILLPHTRTVLFALHGEPSQSAHGLFSAGEPGCEAAEPGGSGRQNKASRETRPPVVLWQPLMAFSYRSTRQAGVETGAGRTMRFAQCGPDMDVVLHTQTVSQRCGVACGGKERNAKRQTGRQTDRQTDKPREGESE